MYSAEKQLNEALPIMVEASSDENLKAALQNHLDVTKTHLEHENGIQDQMKVNPGRKMCKAMEGIIKERDEMAKKKGDASVIDAGIIAAAQKVEHYEIASYGCLRTWAQSLGEGKAADVLQSILDDEHEANEALTALAEGQLNREAV
jgi:ferritin-like metal-binding protein YciE